MWKKLLFVPLFLFLTGCGNSSDSAKTSENGTGSIVAKLVWGEGKTTAKMVALPAGVTTIRITITGSDMPTITNDFAASAGSGTISGVLAGSGRSETVQGLNAAGIVISEGLASNITVEINKPTNVTINMQLVAALPTAPSGLTATAVSSTQIDLSWINNATTVTGFKVERKTGSGGTYTEILTTGANITSCSTGALSASTNYYFRVRATNSAGDSGYSNEDNATTFDISSGGTTDIVMVKVTGGTFTMGDTDGYSWELPTHQVTVGDFYIGKYEVTQGQWQAVMGSNPSYFNACGDNCPVELVTWNDVQDFITKLNQQKGTKYRLPTEAEWEYAARSGGKSEKYSGGSDVNAVAWYNSNSGSTTHPVGQKQANGLGLYDMSGNVWEWVNDWYGVYGSTAQTNPKGPSTGSSSNRVLRGGSWYGDAYNARASVRYSDYPDYSDSVIGFRLAAPVQ